MTNKVAREFRAGDGSIELLLTEVITSETGTRLLSQLATLKGHDITHTHTYTHTHTHLHTYTQKNVHNPL